MTILIKNIYYMLSYAFTDLNHPIYKRMAGEMFQNSHDLFAAILVNGLRKQVKQGLFKDYVRYSEDLAVLRGKINPRKTIANRMQRKQLLHVEFDEMTENNLYNQIPKTVALLIIRNPYVKKTTKNSLKCLLPYFNEVSTIGLQHVSWSELIYHRHNKEYELLHNICYFIYNSLLLTSENGENQLPDYNEENLSRLFEKFVLCYFQKHHPELKPRASQISWALDDFSQKKTHLPRMQSDITLSGKEKDLIIDTKFYKRMYQHNFETRKHHSNNLYQIFTYVQNKQFSQEKEVSGMLLYAQTYNEDRIQATYSLAGNSITIQSLDLNKEFKEIQSDLEAIAVGIK